MECKELEGIILAKRQHGDAHRLLELLTPEDGRIELWAPCARSSRRRGLVAMDIFATVRMEVRPGKRAGRLGEVQAGYVLQARHNLRTHQQALAAGWFLLLCCKALVPQQAPAEQAYLVVTKGLDRLASAESDGLLAVWHLLHFAGFAPNLYDCSACHQPLTEHAMYLGQDGQLHCGCWQQSAHASRAKAMPTAIAAILRGQQALHWSMLVPFAQWMVWHIHSLCQQASWLSQAQGCLDLLKQAIGLEQAASCSKPSEASSKTVDQARAQENSRSWHA